MSLGCLHVDGIVVKYVVPAEVDVVRMENDRLDGVNAELRSRGAKMQSHHLANDLDLRDKSMESHCRDMEVEELVGLKMVDRFNPQRYSGLSRAELVAIRDHLTHALANFHNSKINL